MLDSSLFSNFEVLSLVKCCSSGTEKSVVIKKTPALQRQKPSGKYFLSVSTQKLWSRGAKAASQAGSQTWQCLRVSHVVLVLAA